MAEFFQKESILLLDSSDLKHYEVAKKRTVIVVDWDDTILPTTWLARNKVSLDALFIPSKFEDDLRSLDAAATSLLRMASYLYGEVIIVTNAQQGWVELSSKKFLPEVHQLLFSSNSAFSVSSASITSEDESKEQGCNVSGKRKRDTDIPEEENDSDEIKIFSARFLFEKEHPGDPSQWKKKAFAKLLKQRIPSQFLLKNKSKSKNLSLSDGEMEALDLLEQSEESSEAGTPKKTLKLERRNSSISLSSLELEDSYEVELDFDDSESLFSIDFTKPIEFDEFELEKVKPEEAEQEKKTKECMNLISIGDCFHDCESLRNLDLPLTLTLKKTVKLIEFPSCEQLQAELENLQLYLDKIIKLKSNSDLVVCRGQQGVI